jgi:hypothetical protein
MLKFAGRLAAAGQASSSTSAGSMPSRVMRSRIWGHSCSRNVSVPSRATCRPRLADEHADAALDADQPVGLELLVGLGHGQRIGALLGGERAHRGQHVAFRVAPSMIAAAICSRRRRYTGRLSLISDAVP